METTPKGMPFEYRCLFKTDPSNGTAFLIRPFVESLDMMVTVRTLNPATDISTLASLTDTL